MEFISNQVFKQPAQGRPKIAQPGAELGAKTKSSPSEDPDRLVKLEKDSTPAVHPDSSAKRTSLSRKASNISISSTSSVMMEKRDDVQDIKRGDGDDAKIDIVEKCPPESISTKALESDGHCSSLSSSSTFSSVVAVDIMGTTPSSTSSNGTPFYVVQGGERNFVPSLAGHDEYFNEEKYVGGSSDPKDSQQQSKSHHVHPGAAIQYGLQMAMSAGVTKDPTQCHVQSPWTPCGPPIQYGGTPLSQLMMSSPPPLTSHYSPYPVVYPPAEPSLWKYHQDRGQQLLLPDSEAVAPESLRKYHQDQQLQDVAPPPLAHGRPNINANQQQLEVVSSTSRGTSNDQGTSKSTATGKKRKGEGPETEKSNRKPQKRYSFSLTDTDKQALFTSKKSDRIPLTTNVARKVEALDPITKARVRTFISCSAAARTMDINRTKMSRTCRAGGGRIGDYFFQYVDMSLTTSNNANADINANSNADNSRTGSAKAVDDTVVAAASALLLL